MTEQVNEHQHTIAYALHWLLADPTHTLRVTRQLWIDDHRDDPERFPLKTIGFNLVSESELYLIQFMDGEMDGPFQVESQDWTATDWMMVENTESAA